MPHTVVATGLEDVVEAHDVRLHVAVGIRDGIPHTSLRRQIDDDLGTVLCEERFDERTVGDGTLDEGPAIATVTLGFGRNFPQAVVLQPHVVIVCH